MRELHVPGSGFTLALVAGILFLAQPGAARDLKDVITDLTVGATVSTTLDQHNGLLLEAGFGGAGLESIAESSFQLINDRIVPLSSGVTGFTYEYNEDLDIYERSTKTFGPLFNERAQTLGRGRILVGMSYSVLRFKEFDGNDLDSLRASELQGAQGVGTVPGSTNSALAQIQLAGLDLATVQFDTMLDLDIEEQVSTLHLTYGLTDRVDVGLVLPLIHFDIKARATIGSGLADLQSCAGQPPLPLTTCGAVIPQSRIKEDHTGFGDLILRGKWNFLSTPDMNAAALLSMTIPTGDPDNLTGLHTMTFTPGVVFSRDFDTAIGGFGFQGLLAYEIRPDEGKRSEIEWGAGVSYQPLSRASMSLDLLGSEEVSNNEFGKSLIDLSVGAKFNLWSGLLLDLNYLYPLNDQGLRPDGIFTAQVEFVFGD